MRTLVVSTFAALLFSTGLALAQGSGAAGDIGSSSVRGAQSAPAAGTVGQSAADPTTAAPAPKAKRSAKKKK